MNEFDTNAFAEGLTINFQQLNRAFSKIGYDAKLVCIKYQRVLHGKNNKTRWEGKPLYRSRAYIKALRNRKRKGCMKYAKRCPRPRV